MVLGRFLQSSAEAKAGFGFPSIEFPMTPCIFTDFVSGSLVISSSFRVCGSSLLNDNFSAFSDSILQEYFILGIDGYENFNPNDYAPLNDKSANAFSSPIYIIPIALPVGPDLTTCCASCAS
jgi:hypothetical protein